MQQATLESDRVVLSGLGQVFMHHDLYSGRISLRLDNQRKSILMCSQRTRQSELRTNRKFPRRA